MIKVAVTGAAGRMGSGIIRKNCVCLRVYGQVDRKRTRRRSCRAQRPDQVQWQAFHRTSRQCRKDS